MSDWQHLCILCARRDRETRLEAGHVCAPCATHLADDITAIAELACAAAAYIAPTTTPGGYATGAFGSRPPINVAAVDPELTVVHPDPDDDTYAPTILELLEAWERIVRDDRGMARYGVVSHARTLLAGAAPNDTGTTLIGVTAFLRAQVPWMQDTPAFPIDLFAGEVHVCVRALRRWSEDGQDRGTAVRCPTLTDAGECRAWLTYRDWDERVTCPRCHEIRDAATLALIAMSDGREVWLDPEAAAKWLCVSERTLQRMAKRGEIERSHGRYLVRHAKVTA